MEMDGGVKESQVHFDFLIHVLGWDGFIIVEFVASNVSWRM